MTNQELIKEIAGIIKGSIEEFFNLKDIGNHTPDEQERILKGKIGCKLSDLFEREDKIQAIHKANGKSLIRPLMKFNPSQFNKMCGAE